MGGAPRTLTLSQLFFAHSKIRTPLPLTRCGWSKTSDQSSGQTCKQRRSHDDRCSTPPQVRLQVARLLLACAAWARSPGAAFVQGERMRRARQVAETGTRLTRICSIIGLCRNTGKEESEPREEEVEMPVSSTPALVSSGFKRRQALKAVEVCVSNARNTSGCFFCCMHAA